MLQQQLIDKIQQKIQQLYQQTEQLDQHNQSIHSEQFKYREIFNGQYFSCQSHNLVDYVRELEQNFQKLLQLNSQEQKLLQELGERFNQQLATLSQLTHK